MTITTIGDLWVRFDVYRSSSGYCIWYLHDNCSHLSTVYKPKPTLRFIITWKWHTFETCCTKSSFIVKIIIFTNNNNNNKIKYCCADK